MTVAILVDVTKCIGCEKCVGACVRDNKLGIQNIPLPQHSQDGLSAHRFTTIVKHYDPNTKKIRYAKNQCRHCVEPACVSACLVGALTRNEKGQVVYNKKRCMGCRYCMIACPFNIPKYGWEEAIPYVMKCNLCFDRTCQGKIPSCVEACPNGTIEFGERDILIKKAWQTIQNSKDENGNYKYLQKVYGETEVGGTALLYISDIPLDFLFGKMGDEPLPNLTWNALKKVPAEFFGMGAIMAGLYWIIGRRMKLQQQKLAAKAEEK